MYSRLASFWHKGDCVIVARGPSYPGCFTHSWKHIVISVIEPPIPLLCTVMLWRLLQQNIDQSDITRLVLT